MHSYDLHQSIAASKQLEAVLSSSAAPSFMCYWNTYHPTLMPSSTIIHTNQLSLTTPSNFISRFNQCIRGSAGVRQSEISIPCMQSRIHQLDRSPAFSSPISRPEDDDGPLLMHHLVSFLR
uniref:Uncharacterized protein n=1 Tax=Leptocylindrus danicus TaxID=163516 RepID=A0A7S2L5N9_9STRA|mmetsp:Transcript_31468/g.45851  ORF Transcript_31468/g.45851 Transcript_31468/m.45851 type:complete len:121 (+) Transcript_31468:45-407(+)